MLTLTLTPTENYQSINGFPHRLWNGFTETGIGVVVAIAIVKTRAADAPRLEKELHPIEFPVDFALIGDKYFT